MNFKKIIMVTLMIGVTGSLIANEAKVLMDFNPETPDSKLIAKKVEISDKNEYFISKGCKWLILGKLTEIDPAKTYTLSGSFMAPGDKPETTYFGFICYDSKKKMIKRFCVLPLKNTMTELVAPAKKGDTEIKLKNCSKWKSSKKIPIVFKAEEDFSDLPNYLLQMGNNLKKDGDIWVFSLDKPLRWDFEAGTKVRQHRHSGGYMYNVAAATKIKNKWTDIKNSIKGLYKDNGGYDKFWPGTTYIKVIIITNYNNKKDGITYFKNIKLTEQD